MAHGTTARQPRDAGALRRQQPKPPQQAASSGWACKASKLCGHTKNPGSAATCQKCGRLPSGARGAGASNPGSKGADAQIAALQRQVADLARRLGQAGDTPPAANQQICPAPGARPAPLESASPPDIRPLEEARRALVAAGMDSASAALQEVDVNILAAKEARRQSQPPGTKCRIIVQKIDKIRASILRGQEATAAAEQQTLHAQAIRGEKLAAISAAEVDLAAAQAELAAFTEVHADLPVQIRSDPVWQQRFAAFWGEVNAAAKQAEEAAAARSR